MDMKLIKIVVAIGIFLAFTLVLYLYLKPHKQKMKGFAQVNSVAAMVALFPTTAHDIKTQTEQAISQAQKAIEILLAVPAHERTYENTAYALDVLGSLSDVAILRSSLSAIEMVSPQEELRSAAHDAVKTINDFWVDAIENNVKVYQALKEYAADGAQQENLTEEQRYFLQKTLEDFKRGGSELPEAKRQEVGALKKELAKLEQEFEVNIAADNKTISVQADDLAGLDQSFIDTLVRAEDGGYILGVDYPTYFNVMDNCSVSQTRKKLYRAFNQRAYPINDANLKLVIAKRDQLAHLLGFESYAQLDLADQMVKTPERAEKFLHDLIKRASAKEQQEFERLVGELPENISLTADGKFNPWDISYIKAQYKKKHFTIDERAIAEYFPMQKTIDGLLDIYKKFFSLEFKEVPVSGLWHDDVRLIEVYDAEKNFLGYLLLDLYPRPNKFSHACNMTIVSAVITPDGKRPPAVSLVIANFPKPTAEKPSLLKRDDVNTFFHEFGHALHGLLGRTAVASFSGTSVKRDFVELPSQMLEEWLSDKEIIRNLSSHYITGAQLPEDILNNILRLKHFDSGYFVVRQGFLAQLALDYYKNGAVKDVAALLRDNFIRTLTHTAFDPENHMYASFGHLMGYGAKYYGYLWSKVFALDLFDAIKKEGLLNPVMGKKYVDEVIGKGGSVDPNILLRNFLGREPNQEAFLKDLGL